MNLNFHIVPGTVAPRSDVVGSPVQVTDVYITEQGTECGLPIVDFVGIDETGVRRFFSITGRLVNATSAVVRGVNIRIHGAEEP